MEMYEKIKKLTVKTFSGCNLNCQYCHQLNDDKHKPLSFTKYDELSQFLLTIPLDDKVIVSIVGGEVSLRPDLIENLYKKSLLKVSRQKDVQFECGTVTNGTNIDYILDLCDRDIFKPKHCAFSWDGLYSASLSRKCNGLFNDEFFQNVVKKIGKSKHRDDFTIVHAITPETLDYLYDSFKFCIDNGAINFGYYLIHEGNYSDINLQEKFKNQIYKIYNLYVEEANKGNYINLFNWLNITLRRRINEAFFTCAKLGINYYIDPDGDIYPCIYFGDHRAYKFGNIKTGIDKNIQDKFIEDYYHYPQCEFKTCKCYQCNECPASNYVHNGNMNMRFKKGCELYQIENQIYDELSKKIIRQDIYTSEDRNRHIFDLNKFVDCELDITQNSYQSPNLEFVRKWRK